jgi:cytochrome c oxidase assembly protein Cox11
MSPTRHKNLKIIVPCIAVIGIMLGLVAYSPTLYRLFCAATGYGGTTQRTASGSDAVSQQMITVRFDANVAPGLPWRFEPEQNEVKVQLGENKLVFFSAQNFGDQAIVGHATFNVTPGTAGIYFNKIQCFCFDEERLDAHQKVDMPVVFFVDPALATDRDTRDIDTITLSYTFFRSTNPGNAKDLSRFVASAEPNPARGQQLFSETCAACHGLDKNKTGPSLAGVFERKAGSAAGYKYSSALAQSGIRWSADDLDRWLTDPRKFIAGVRMPARVPNASARRDIIAFLKQESQKRAERTAGAVAQSSSN